MQTFLPHENFTDSARALDTRRLGKQSMEARQILSALQAGPGAPWYGHPAVQMWRGYEDGLRLYGFWMCGDWLHRTGKVRAEQTIFAVGRPYGEVVMPAWYGDKAFHAGHRGHLFRKDPAHYSAFAADATAPLLYPVTIDGQHQGFVERTEPGKFRAWYVDRMHFAVGNPVRSSVLAAWTAAHIGGQPET